MRVKIDPYVKAAHNEHKYPDSARNFFYCCIRYFNRQSQESHDPCYFGYFSRLIESALSEKEKLEGGGLLCDKVIRIH